MKKFYVYILCNKWNGTLKGNKGVRWMGDKK